MANYTEFEVKGTPSYTLNLLVKAGVSTREVCVENLYVRFKVSINEREKSINALEKARREYRILSENSIEKSSRKYMKYTAFLMGIIVSIALIFFYSNCVFFVNVIGTKTIDREEILAVVNKDKKGVIFKHKTDVKSLEKELVNLPKVSHAKVTLKGSSMNIEIVEQLTNTEILVPQTMENIFSKEDAIITKIVVISGTPKVKVGDSVKKGQVLVEASKLDINGELIPCPTQAVIEGRVWRVEKFAVEGVVNAQTIDEIERRKREFISALDDETKFIKSWYFIKRLDNASIISIYYEIINTIV